MTLGEALAEAYEYCIGTGHCKAIDLVQRVLRDHPDLIFDESPRLIRRQLRLEAKNFMKRHEVHEDVTSENQLDLPLGILPGLIPPRTLVVIAPDGEYEHVRYDVATWADLEAALEEKTLNIDRAILRREDHLRKMDALAPHMRDYPERTVDEACELMRKDTH